MSDDIEVMSNGVGVDGRFNWARHDLALGVVFEREFLRGGVHEKINAPRRTPAIASRRLVEVKVGWSRTFPGVAKDIQVIVLNGWLFSGYQVRENLCRAT